MTMLKVNHVEKSFGSKQVLKSINFECKKGDIFGIFGRNGSGKSTLLKILFGTMQYDRFEAFLGNKTYNPEANIKKQEIAYLPQHNILPLNKKVRDIVTMFYSNPYHQDRVLYNSKIATFDSKKFGQLSGGQKRCFEIVLLSQLPHKVMIFDEPFSLIDPIEQELISNLLEELKEDKIIIITDHYYRNVLEITDKNIVISNGASETVESINELKELGYLNK